MDEDAKQSRPVTLKLDEGRPEGANSWTLPSWGHLLSCGIFPLLISEEGKFTPIGSAFCISRLGVVATAAHNVAEALRRHPRGQQILQREEFPRRLDLGGLGLSLLHTWRTNEGLFQVNLWPLEGGNGVYLEDEKQPADILFAFPKHQREFPFIPLRISFAVPRVGSRVKCFGYTETRVAGGTILANDLKEGKIDDWGNFYQHRFTVVEGKVTKVFTQGFARGYLRGACFAIDAEVGHGQSGGPVFNEEGYVCGVVSAGATNFFGQPSSLISSFYPTLMTGVDFGISKGPVRINAQQSLLEMIDRGTIETDGSEELVTLLPEGDSWRVGTLIHSDDTDSVHDSFGNYQDGVPATMETQDVYRIRRKTGQ